MVSLACTVRRENALLWLIQSSLWYYFLYWRLTRNLLLQDYFLLWRHILSTMRLYPTFEHTWLLWLPLDTCGKDRARFAVSSGEFCRKGAFDNILKGILNMPTYLPIYLQTKATRRWIYRLYITDKRTWFMNLQTLLCKTANPGINRAMAGHCLAIGITLWSKPGWVEANIRNSHLIPTSLPTGWPICYGRCVAFRLGWSSCEFYRNWIFSINWA